jgi:glycosyltransferase involved in cell wall biosynthesis
MSSVTTEVAPAAGGDIDGSPYGPVLPALVQRLQQAAQVLVPDAVEATGDPRIDGSVLLDRLVRQVHAHRDEASLWLLWTAIAASFPRPDDVIAARRALDLHDPPGAAAWLLNACFAAARSTGSPDMEIDVLVGQVVVDVDFCARNNLHTGIQRVVRETLPRWARDHDVVLVAWTARDGCYRTLSDTERRRVLEWGRHEAPDDKAPTLADDVSRRLVVPWRSTLVLPESTEPQRCPMLSAIGEFSGSTVAAIGYDCIPVVSPDLVHPALPDRFAQYLTAIKSVHRVAAISRSAAAEFEGFASMLTAQGRPGPSVAEVQLPVEVPEWVKASTAGPADPPMILGVGSFEPRKNQLAVMHAAERLWREGLRFQLTFIGGGGWRTEFDETFKKLSSAGRPIQRLTAVREEQLWQTYHDARVTVFASLHEGYGLPVAESLACGTPVVTTSYGSTREIAEGGGALLVDPRDDDALTDVLRRVLTDDALLEELRAQARARAPRTWDDYARELWDTVTEPAHQLRPDERS